MNTYYIEDESFKETDIYKKIMDENPKSGNLRIRAYAASQAIPVSNVKITIRKIYENNIIIFYEGYTNESGVIDKITLPTPELNKDNMDVPAKAIYTLIVNYNKINEVYDINMYEGICVIQNINIVPNNIGETSG